MKSYTHAKGFNVTSVEGISGIYLFMDANQDLIYIGASRDFRNRINSHVYQINPKLTKDVQYLYVIKANPGEESTLHVLEHLFIWYLHSLKNHAHWLYYGSNFHIKEIAIKHGLNIRSTIYHYLMSFETGLLIREYEDDGSFKRYGSKEEFKQKKVICSKEGGCMCFRCVMKNNRREGR
ncbi:GIY-YIG nuclease family protein [Halobacillus sp. B29]|uniref:GIY-YIG nuclease family protein n=1 Tax=Halobacillus sp. B29 TaxID=3457432 RepID=UPI003FCDFB19